VKDPLDPDRILYHKEHLLWLGIPLFMMHLGSRRQLPHEQDTLVFTEKLRRRRAHFPIGTVAVPDTLYYIVPSA
jgi:hypothetical protein